MGGFEYICGKYIELIYMLNIDFIIEDILNGMTYRAMAQKYGVPLSTFNDFISNPEHSARAKNAQITSAQTFEDKAEEVLINAERDGVEIQRAKELSQLYKWKARVRNPKAYGDKIDVTSDGEKINTIDPFSQIRQNVGINNEAKESD